jgi:hypothetical protein
VQQPAGRGTAAKVALAVVAALLFVIAAGGGFALTRAVGGQPIKPPLQQPSPQPAASAPLTGPMVNQQGDATNVTGSKGGLFTVDVPQKWAKFVTLQPAGKLSASTLVQFVSADGRQVLDVQRFADYFTRHTSEDDYVKALQSTFGLADFFVADRKPLTGGRQGVRLTYAALERATAVAHPAPSGASTAPRTTFADIFQLGNSLWVVSVTVAADQKGSGAGLFDRIAGSFKPTN